MKIPLKWLADYVDITLPASEIADRLTMAGTEISAVVRSGGDWDGISVGLVVGVEPHPNADRLRLATVDTGKGRRTVVCGAPNIAVGQKIAFAELGARLIDGHSRQPSVLRAAKIRGVESAGMVCSERELGLSDEHEGILVLPPDAPTGVPLAEVLGDTILDAEITPNRPDCLSILGAARELAALTGQRWRDPPLEYAEEGPPIESLTSIEVRDPDLCPRYFVTLVTGITVGPSPAWLQERLIACGMRPINNVVDITNYVMLETGQPLHAFDHAKLSGGRIVVRRSRQGEPITTLYGETYELDGEVLCVCDAAEPVTLGGILGATKAEVSETTRDVLLEAANFSPRHIRHTVKLLGPDVHTEAAVRNERGLNPEMTSAAALRCTRLFLELCGGKAARGRIDVYPGRPRETRVAVSKDRLARVLGVDLPVSRVRRVLNSLGLAVRWETAGERYIVRPPYWRSDIRHADDVAEEVARVVGYDALPTTTLRGALPRYQPNRLYEVREEIRRACARLGFQETITYPLTTRRSLVGAIGRVAVEAAEPLRVANPISAEREVLRTSLRPGILEALALNGRREGPVRLFELGKIYLPRPDDLPEEWEKLAALLYGERLDRWGHPSGERLDFYDARGFVEALGGELGVEFSFRSGAEFGLLEGRTAQLLAGKTAVGVLGQVHPDVTRIFELNGEVLLVEIDVEPLVPLVPKSPRYRAIPRFPAVREDLSVIVGEDIEAGRMAEAIRRHRLVEAANVFDVYTGDPVPAGKKSLSFSIAYRAPDHTLNEAEIGEARQQIIARLGAEFGAELRG